MVCLLLLSCQTNLENQALASNLSAGNILSADDDENFALERNQLNNASWFREMYDAYEPDKNAISAIEKHRNDIKFVVFGGSWCSDTRKALPKFYKVVEQANVQASKIELYGVDHDKKSQENGGKGKSRSDEFGINRVPEFIVFYKEKEVGRLNEKPSKSLEEDLAKMLNKQ